MKKHIQSLIGLEKRISGFYPIFAEKIANFCGQSKIFTFACLIIVFWFMSGPIFNFSDTWQLIINTGTTIITFLMMFLLQNTHNRDIDAIQKKLDALLIEISKLTDNKPL